MSCIGLAVRFVEFAISQEGLKRTNEPIVGARYSKYQHSPFKSAYYTLCDIFELAFNLRGIGFEFSRGLRLPEDPRPLHDRISWIQYTIVYRIVPFYLLTDFINWWHLQNPTVSALFHGHVQLSTIPMSLKFFITYSIAWRFWVAQPPNGHLSSANHSSRRAYMDSGHKNGTSYYAKRSF
ncbi:hypothetical protein FRB99_003117 [Tulasnella sp. 403]|nr:hypothetical protein FRB99_003117 [Tulasnella sp. 403]